MTSTRTCFGRASAVLSLLVGASAAAQGPTTRSAADELALAALQQEAEPEQAPPEGLLRIPVYGGALASRATLTGDWGGARTRLAERGVQLDLRFNQYVQGVTEGGRERDVEYGGNGDALVLLDLMRMGVVPGALVKLRLESRYGDSVNGIAGPLLPVNTDHFFPLTDELDEDLSIAITALSWTQFLSESFGVYFGKLDTLDGDPNEFASGRGVTQFQNANFVFNATLALRMPYSTLGAGLVWLPRRNITVTTGVMNTVDSSTTSGFDDFGDGTTWTAEADFQYELEGMPGGQNVGFLWSFDQDFAELGGRLILEPGQGFVVPTEDETWAAYWSFWQYLWQEEPSRGLVDLANGRADLEGVGPFARLGFADGDTNPIDWTISAGLGGRGLVPTRDHDTFGIGYYYARVQEARLSSAAGIGGHGEGFEVFYDVALTPAVHLTFDLQVDESPFESLDAATVLGARLSLAL